MAESAQVAQQLGLDARRVQVYLNIRIFLPNVSSSSSYTSASTALQALLPYLKQKYSIILSFDL